MHPNLEQKNILMVHQWSTTQAFLFIITTRSRYMHVKLALHPDGRSSHSSLSPKEERNQEKEEGGEKEERESTIKLRTDMKTIGSKVRAETLLPCSRQVCPARR
jgi:hypothetical protein